MPDPVREPARAKMNLRLRVLGRDEEGYHALESVFLRIDLTDEVELRAGGEGIELEVEAASPSSGPGPGAPEQGSLFPPAGPASGAGAPGGGDGESGSPGDGVGGEGDGPEGAGGRAGGRAPERPPPVDLEGVPRGGDNLCWRAAASFYDALGREPGVSIRLLKRIPAAGGLGGGSADAAAVLRGLARLHEQAPARTELLRLAGALGSDVPFALLDRPMALGWERGRRLMPLPPPPPRPMLLVVPRARVSTPEAYRWLDEDRAEGRSGAAGVLPPADELVDWETLFSLRGNDFETSVFSRLPELGWWKEELLGEGAEAALLCGSGSTLCGIFGDARRRDAAAERLREGAEVRVVRTRGPV